jgi:hypothetical protein
VYRYVGNNPVNWTDPSGMLSVSEYGNTAAISTAALLTGVIATQFDLSSGIKTARYLQSGEANSLSMIAAGISCTFFILSDALRYGGDFEDLAVDRNVCGIHVTKAANDNFPEFVPSIKPNPPRDQWREEIGIPPPLPPQPPETPWWWKLIEAILGGNMNGGG